MHVVGIILVFAAFPLFAGLLGTRQAQRWAILAMGALPILFVPLHLEAAVINWAAWPGHTKGVILTLLDPLALAVCVHLRSGQRVPPLGWAYAVYLASLIPGVFTGSLFQPAFFYFFQTLRAGIFFYTCFLIVLQGELPQLARGMAIAIVLNAFVALQQGLSGLTQAPGMLGHQNLTGMSVNICVPLLVALGLRRRGGFFLFAVAAAGASAIAGGSRATIIFYGVAVATTLIGSSIVEPTSRKMALLACGAVALLAASPFAVHKLGERAGLLTPDLERAAFERAAHMMIEDHPWGVGINQYVVVANTQGYMSRAGVRWGADARSTNVHNFYLLARTEGGLIELLGVLSWLICPLLVAVVLAFRKKTPFRDVCVALAMALGVTAAHNQYEWIFITAVPQYLFASMIGILAAIQVAARTSQGSKRRLPADEANGVEVETQAA